MSLSLHTHTLHTSLAHSGTDPTENKDPWRLDVHANSFLWTRNGKQLNLQRRSQFYFLSTCWVNSAILLPENWILSPNSKPRVCKRQEDLSRKQWSETRDEKLTDLLYDGVFSMHLFPRQESARNPMGTGQKDSRAGLKKLHWPTLGYYECPNK